MPEPTYGAGPSTSGKNVGPDHSTVSKLGPYGKVYDKNGDLVFDPTVNMVEQIDPDAEPVDLPIFLASFTIPGDPAIVGDNYEENVPLLGVLDEWVVGETPTSEDIQDIGSGYTFTTSTYEFDLILTYRIDAAYVADPPGGGEPVAEYAGVAEAVIETQTVRDDQGTVVVPPPESPLYSNMTVTFDENQAVSTYGSATEIPLDQAAWILEGTYIEASSSSDVAFILRKG